MTAAIKRQKVLFLIQRMLFSVPFPPDVRRDARSPAYKQAAVFSGTGVSHVASTSDPATNIKAVSRSDSREEKLHGESV